MNPQIPQITSQKRSNLALWLLIGPTVLFIMAILLGLLSHFVPEIPPTNGELFGQTPAIVKVANIFAFLFGAIAFLTWLPGIVIGIIILTKKK